MKTADFLESVIPHLDLREKTKKNYLGAFRKNLNPTIGHKELGDVTKAEIMSCLDILPPQTKYQTLMAARTIFREAVDRDLITENPAKTIRQPKITVKQQKFLTWEELSAIDFGWKTKRIHFLALHGLRYGEAAALTEADIYDGKVHITKSKYGPTKTKSGIRAVPLMSEFVPFPKCQQSIAEALRPYGVTVHSLRKTYAYLLKSSSIHVTTASQYMGHSNPMITLSVYTQVLDSEIETTRQALSDYIKKAS